MTKTRAKEIIAEILAVFVNNCHSQVTHEQLVYHGMLNETYLLLTKALERGETISFSEGEE